jgi:hypothetical protein
LLTFGVTVEDIDNPPREGYLDLFEASLKVKPSIQLQESVQRSSEDSESTEGENNQSSSSESRSKLIQRVGEWKGVDVSTRSMIKHGQKVFLRKKLKKIKVVSPFSHYCPGFYSSEFRVQVEQGSTYAVKIIPISDDPEITFEPSEILFDANDFVLLDD